MGKMVDVLTREIVRIQMGADIGTRDFLCTLRKAGFAIVPIRHDRRGPEIAMDVKLFPLHEASLHLEHNDHKSYYKTVAQAVADEDHGYTDECWISEEQRQKAIATNDAWTLQWYPRSPVSFYILAAADLDVLLDAAREVKD